MKTNHTVSIAFICCFSFLTAIKKYGVATQDMFQLPDLFDAQCLPLVASTLQALAFAVSKPNIKE